MFFQTEFRHSLMPVSSFTLPLCVCVCACMWEGQMEVSDHLTLLCLIGWRLYACGYDSPHTSINEPCMSFQCSHLFSVQRLKICRSRTWSTTSFLNERTHPLTRVITTNFLNLFLSPRIMEEIFLEQGWDHLHFCGCSERSGKRWRTNSY